jgi:hypothetical protein
MELFFGKMTERESKGEKSSPAGRSEIIKVN